MRAALASQIAQEKRCWQAAAASEQALSRASECRQPKPRHDFQTARLFLAHFGFLDPHDSEEVINNLYFVILYFIFIFYKKQYWG